MIYALISFFATTIGTIAGVGGGLIIRPMLNLLGIGKGLASFTSAITVLGMALTNYVFLIAQGKKINYKNVLFIGIGVIIGASIGGSLVPHFESELINILYLFAVVLMFLSVILRDKIILVGVKNPFFKIVLGVLCGTLSSFFGIGGGPFLMTVLLVFIKLEAKEAAIQSVLITMLSTTSSLGIYALNGYANFSLAVYCAPAGVLGGIIGRILTSKLNDKKVKITFVLVLIAIMSVQLYIIFFQ